MVCNPPYVSTGEEEVSSGTQLAAAWAGGERGMSVTRELLRALPSLLSQQAGVLVSWPRQAWSSRLVPTMILIVVMTQGVAFIVLEQCNKPKEVQEYVE